jgi:hypothetical protein
VIRSQAVRGVGTPSHDLYQWAYPNMQYALRSLARGYGLWWNPFQNCGQPFFANLQNSLLYPPYLVFTAFPLDAAYLALVVVNLTIAGIGAWLLFRHYRVGRAAALCGAFLFELGGSAPHLATWAPTLLGAYAWLPMALYACERVLARPSARAGILLGAVLALQLLASYPQVSLFSYLLVTLRVLFELVTRRDRTALRATAAVLLGLVLAPMLCAVQLLPASEVVARSLRGEALTRFEKDPRGFDWERFREATGARQVVAGNVFAALPSALALLGLLAPARRRMAVFFLLAGALFFALAFDNALFRLFDRIPVVSTFRNHQRFLWLVAVPLAGLAAFGADWLVQAHTRERGFPLLATAFVLVALAGFGWLSPTGILAWEWLLVLAAAGASAAAVLWRSRGSAWLPRVLLPALIGAGALAVASRPVLSFLPDGSVYQRHAAALELVRARATLQERADVLGENQDLALMRKLGTVFELPVIRDYEPLTSQRFAELSVVLFRPDSQAERDEMRGRMAAGLSPMRSRNDYTFLRQKMPADRRLYDLLATRYLVVDAGLYRPHRLPGAPLRRIGHFGEVVVFENPQALERAFYVPKLVVEPEPYRILSSLAWGPFDPRQAALVEEAPPDGFLGAPGPAVEGPPGGSVEILSDRGEQVTLRAEAGREGFVFMSDQHYPGWEATVNGVRTEVLRANFAFRAFRVPAGRSEITLRYRPKTLRLGAAISLATILFAGSLAFATRPRDSRLG